MTYRDKLLGLEIEAKRRFFVLEDILIPKIGVPIETTYDIISEKIMFSDTNYKAVFCEYIMFYLLIKNKNFLYTLDTEMGNEQNQALCG